MNDTLVDGHVHFHECFSLTTFLESAANNFALASSHPVVGVLLLAHIGPGDPLQPIRNQFQRMVAEWKVAEPESSSIVFSHPRKSPIVFIAGRQIVTREKLELLSLCSSKHLTEGQSLRESVDATFESEGVPVLPWGFGKWWFARGRALQTFLQRREAAKPYLLGDNGCRLSLHRPSLLRASEDHGIPVLAGSDPLPLRSHVTRPASFGSIFQGQIDLKLPTVWMRAKLLDLCHSPKTFGKCRSPVQFGNDQLQLRCST
jgi:hypothetical protein